ncbi:MAG: hypothetical protein HY860_01660 [Chlamydiales bacterium]|nr:hypothetical protein [Chlamydiales bacterium]
MRRLVRLLFDFPCKCCGKEREKITGIICNTCRDFLLEALLNPLIQKTHRGWMVCLMQHEGPMNVLLEELKHKQDKGLIKALASILFLSLEKINATYNGVVYIMNAYPFIEKIASEIAKMYQTECISCKELEQENLYDKRFLVVTIHSREPDKIIPTLNTWNSGYQTLFDCIAIK